MADVLAVLKQGMGTEIWGKRFYQEAAARTKDANGIKVFESLVDEESKHLDILRGQYAAVSGDQKWVSLDQAIAMSDSVKATDIFPKADEAESLIPEAATDEQALQMAMEFEERGYRMYQLAAQQATSLDEKAVWEWLAKAENLHFTFIQDTHEYLVNNGKWYFDDQELPIFEG